MKRIYSLLLFLLCAVSLFAQETVALENFEKHVSCQNGEDGIIEKIASLLRIDQGYYVEFGVEDGQECNTRYLREKYGWKGLLMDGGNEAAEINLKREFITAENIIDLFRKYDVPAEFDLLSIDIDYNDFYVWRTVANLYSPKVVIIEYNATHLPSEDKVIVYEPFKYWDSTNYYGASILAHYQLGRKNGYSLVYAEKNGVNLFFIRDDLINRLNEDGVAFKDINDVEKIYSYPNYGPYGWGPNGGHHADELNRPYVSAKELLNSGYDYWFVR